MTTTTTNTSMQRSHLIIVFNKINVQVKTKWIILLLMSGCVKSAWAQEVWTVGPMVHINFSKGQKTRVSGGVEFAYWNFNHFFHSVDGGFEFEKSKFRIYSELQTGILLTGISCGPVLEFSNTGTHVGIQGSAWLNYFLGFDYRKRWIDGKRYNIGGAYVKLPVATTGLETNGTNSSHHHSDADWHDFF